MQGIYTHIPETNYVPREYSVAAILLFLFMVLIVLVSVLNLLYFYISTFRSMCAVPNMAVFCSLLTSWFPGMLLTYFLNVFEIVTVTPIITGITFVFTFHMRCISIVRSSYFRIFSASFLIIFLSPEIATSINIDVPFSLSRIIMSGLLLGIVLSVCTCWFHNMVTLPPWLVSTDFGTCSYQLLLLLLLLLNIRHKWNAQLTSLRCCQQVIITCFYKRNFLRCYLNCCPGCSSQIPKACKYIAGTVNIDREMRLAVACSLQWQIKKFSLYHVYYQEHCHNEHILPVVEQVMSRITNEND